MFIVDISGVYLSHGVGNNSNIPLEDIGEGDSEALLCYTDLIQCCRAKDTLHDSLLGEWIFPNGSVVQVGTNRSGSDLYMNRGSSVVRLNRRNNATSPEGVYCCVIPDATFISVTICANVYCK